MIQIGDDAREHVRRLLAADGSAGGGLRIAASAGDTGDEGQLACEMEIAPHPEPHVVWTTR